MASKRAGNQWKCNEEQILHHNFSENFVTAQNIYYQKLESLGYIFVADSIDLSSFKFSQWAPKEERVLKQSAWPVKVIQGHWFWHQSKDRRLYDFLFDLNSNLGLVLSCRVSEILELFYAKNHFFPHTTPIRAKISGCSLIDPSCWGLRRANFPG